MLIPTKLQQVLEGLHIKFSRKAEDAHRTRDSADLEGRPEQRAYAAGKAAAHTEDEGSVRDAEANADK